MSVMPQNPTKCGWNRMQLPDAGNASETANTGSGGTYYSKSFSAPDSPAYSG